MHEVQFVAIPAVGPPVRGRLHHDGGQIQRQRVKTEYAAGFYTMDELPGDIWGVIARNFVLKTELAPVSRGLYALTISAVEDAVAGAFDAAKDKHVSVKIGDIIVKVSTTNIHYHYDVTVMEGGFWRCIFGLRSKTGTYESVPGRIKIADLYFAPTQRWEKMPISPLLCNYIVLIMCTRHRLHYYPDWVLDYVRDCRGRFT